MFFFQKRIQKNNEFRKKVDSQMDTKMQLLLACSNPSKYTHLILTIAYENTIT